MEYKYIKGLLKRNIDGLKGRRWYHQRFDGTPYFIHYIAESEIVVHEERKKGADFTVHAGFFGNDRHDWYIEFNEMKKVTDAVIKLAKDDPKNNVLKLWEKDEKKFFVFCLELEKIDLKKLSDKELVELHNKAREIGFNRFSSSSLIDGFALYTDEIIAEKIKELIKNKPDYKFPRVFSKLTAPIHQSFINDAEIQLLNIAMQPKEKQKELLKEHSRKWFWIHNNYAHSYVITAEDFEKEIEEMKKSNVDFKEQKEKIETTPARNKEEKEKLMKELNVGQELNNLLSISEQFTYWQDERKRATYWLIHYYSPLIAEIGERVGLTLHEMKYLSPTEVSHLFDSEPDKDEIRKRMKMSASYWDKEGHECITDEKEIEELRKIILGSKDYLHMETFTGLCAAVGKAVGKVRICKSATEVGKVSEGDVLVAVMTRPDYVVGMKKACAIVTNEGGITSHAAIVSRELGIPCVIGTKIATEVLKDGDLVEVNANHGQVKVLERAK